MDIKITSIAEDYTSMKDIEIASLSLNPPAVIITEDKDFGELVFKDKIEVIAVVLLRYNQPDILIIQGQACFITNESPAEAKQYFHSNNF